MSTTGPTQTNPPGQIKVQVAEHKKGSVRCQFVVDDLIQERCVDGFLQPGVDGPVTVEHLVAGGDDHDGHHRPAASKHGSGQDR